MHKIGDGDHKRLGGMEAKQGAVYGPVIESLEQLPRGSRISGYHQFAVTSLKEGALFLKAGPVGPREDQFIPPRHPVRIGTELQLPRRGVSIDEPGARVALAFRPGDRLDLLRLGRRAAVVAERVGDVDMIDGAIAVRQPNGPVPQPMRSRDQVVARDHRIGAFDDLGERLVIVLGDGRDIDFPVPQPGAFQRDSYATFEFRSSNVLRGANGQDDIALRRLWLLGCRV